MKKKTDTHRVEAAKSKLKVIKYGTTPWAFEPNRKGNSRTNDQINKSLYNWIMHHSQVVQSPIVNDCLKVNIYSHTRPYFFTKLLLKVSVRELHNNFASEPVYGGLKEARDTNNNIIISNSTLRSLFPPHLKKNHQDTRSCVVVNVVYIPEVYIPHYYYGVICI